MRNLTAVFDLDVTQPSTLNDGLDRFADAAVLCRLKDRPLGLVRAPIEHGRPALDTALRQFLSELTIPCGVALAERAIASGRPPRWPDAGALLQTVTAPANTGALVTVAVCTTGGAGNLRACLDSLAALEYQPVDVVVIGGAADGNVDHILRHYPDVRYVREPRPGRVWANRRAIAECRGDILAFTDSGAVVDRFWISSIVRAFLADPEVMMVSGLVLPRELRGGTRRFLGEAGGSDGLFQRRWHRAPIRHDAPPVFGAVDTSFGVSTAVDDPAMTNVAFWRSAFDDVKAVHTAVYEPSALVWHQTLSHDEWKREIAAARANAHVDGPRRQFPHRRSSEAGRRIDLAEPLRPISDAVDVDRLRLTVAWEGVRLGEVGIEHRGAVVSAAWLTDVIARELTVPVLDARTGLGEGVLRSIVTATLARALMPAIETSRKDRRRRVSAAA